MMNKKFATKVKNFLVTVCSMALVLSFSVAVPYASEIDENQDISLLASNATAVSFNKVYVDSNSDSSITTKVMTQTKTYAEVKVSHIYDAQGVISTEYKKVKVKATKDGEYYVVTKGANWKQIDIPSAYQFPGASITMYAMGNNSSKDCMISGYWMLY